MGLIILLVVGAIAGWIAGQIMRGGGFGMIGNIALGIVGAVLGGYVLGQLGVSLMGGLIGRFIQAIIGAVILLGIVGLMKK